ncbi:unnamed protein product [Diatraea saccharalis]|uniref:Protein sleepless n=1 Tax=Diatraea saccharalis TaxID=40085 RepID=A0A9N9WH17_9NEOP|nr:unnamed protein product [Diatraea saccharalis]
MRMIALKRYLLLVTLKILILCTGVLPLQCYQCYINPPPGQYYNTTKNLCVHFDYSEKFIVDCPYSTMCMKQDFSLKILGGVTIEGVLRDCASQKNEYHDFQNGKWFPKMEVLEPYEEGCQEVDDKASNGVQCYKCNPEAVPYDTRPTCQHFDGSSRFLVDCDTSTMCYKRITTLTLANGLTTRNEERGCAQQTLSGDQKKINGKWVPVKDIYEVYTESCQETQNDYQRATKTIDCYCRGDMCNGAMKRNLQFFTLISTVAIYVLVR